MYSFYQSDVRKTISKDIFKKEIFDVVLFWKKYWWVKKTHKYFWITLNWFQIVWIKFPNNFKKDEFKYELDNLKKSFHSFNNIFFQLWFVSEISEPYIENRKNYEQNLQKEYELYRSLKENMPLASVIIDLQKEEKEIYSNFSKSAKRNIKKALKNDIYFKLANKNEIDEFYNLWHETSNKKWFNIYDKKTYLKLVNFLKNTWIWDLYIVKKDNKILSWSIEIIKNKESYYLYGATNRDYTKLWSHYFLKYEMFKYLKQKWIKDIDLLWVSPTWYENHHLSWVSQFKHSFWWKHVEYIGNYDLVLNKVLYNILKKIKK